MLTKLKNKNITNPLLNIFSNAILSFSSFIIGIMFIKNGMADEYGEFVFLSAILLVIQGLTYSTYTTYFIINIKKGNIYLYICNSILIILMALGLLYFINITDYLLFIISAIFISFFDFNRQYFISIDNFTNVIFADVIMSLSKVLIMYLYITTTYFKDILLHDMFAIIFFSPFVYYLFVYAYKQSQAYCFKIISFKVLIKETKWSFMENIVHNFASQMHIFFIKFFMGAFALAMYSALSSLFSLLNMFYTGLSQYFLPKIRIAYQNNTELFNEYRGNLYTTFILLSLISVIAINLFSLEIFSFFYTTELYINIESYILIFSILFFLRMISMYYIIINKTMNMYKNTFKVKLYTGIGAAMLMLGLLMFYPDIYILIAIQVVIQSISIYLLKRKI